MKLLLTGMPKSGKSTALSEVLGSVDTVKTGFLTKEVVVDGRRTGFRTIAENGRTVDIAQTDHPTPNQVGRYYIEVEAFSRFIENLPDPQNRELIYIDEIGQMQLLSSRFCSRILSYFELSNDLIATISNVYNDELTERLRVDEGVILFTVEPEIRREIVDCVRVALDCRAQYAELTHAQQLRVSILANKYLNSKQYVSFGKLFSNAIRYVLNDCVRRTDDRGLFTVQGNHAKHIVRLSGGADYECDCPLANGRKPYDARAECSHVQAVLLTQ